MICNYLEDVAKSARRAGGVSPLIAHQGADAPPLAGKTKRAAGRVIAPPHPVSFEMRPAYPTSLSTT
jgi:hypothetical protein